MDIEHRLAKEVVPALLSDLKQCTLDCTDRGGRNIAILNSEILRVVAHKLQHCTKVFHVKEQQAIIVGNLENQGQHALLRIVQIEQLAQQQRPHV